MGMITLLFEEGELQVKVEVDSSIATVDLLEVLDAFIRSMGRSPSGDLDYTVSKL